MTLNFNARVHVTLTSEGVDALMAQTLEVCKGLAPDVVLKVLDSVTSGLKQVGDASGSYVWGTQLHEVFALAASGRPLEALLVSMEFVVLGAYDSRQDAPLDILQTTTDHSPSAWEDLIAQKTAAGPQQAPSATEVKPLFKGIATLATDVPAWVMSIERQLPMSSIARVSGELGLSSDALSYPIYVWGIDMAVYHFSGITDAMSDSTLGLADSWVPATYDSYVEACQILGIPAG